MFGGRSSHSSFSSPTLLERLTLTPHSTTTTQQGRAQGTPSIYAHILPFTYLPAFLSYTSSFVVYEYDHLLPSPFSLPLSPPHIANCIFLSSSVCISRITLPRSASCVALPAMTSLSYAFCTNNGTNVRIVQAQTEAANSAVRQAVATCILLYLCT